MRWILATSTSLLLTVPAWADFELDVSDKDLRYIAGRPAIEDLAVGERGKVWYPQLCRSDDALFIVSSTLLDDSDSSYGSTVEVVREPNRRAALTWTGGKVDPKKPFSRWQTILRVILGARACSVYGFADEDLLRVTSLQGKTTARELIQVPFD